MTATCRHFIWILTLSPLPQGDSGGAENSPLLSLSPPPFPPHINAHVLIHTLNTFYLPILLPPSWYSFCAITNSLSIKIFKIKPQIASQGDHALLITRNKLKAFKFCIIHGLGETCLYSLDRCILSFNYLHSWIGIPPSHFPFQQSSSCLFSSFSPLMSARRFCQCIASN